MYMELDSDIAILIISLILAAWSIYNTNKTAALFILTNSIKKHVALTKESDLNSHRIIQEMIETKRGVIEHYQKLVALNVRFDEINYRNQLLQQVAPEITDKASILSLLVPGDKIFHLSILGDPFTGILDNRITIVYKQKDDSIRFYDRNNKYVTSATRMLSPIVFDWLKPYIDDEQKTA